MNQGLQTGLSVAISVWCGNFPQELGDFALLVRAGMTPFQSLFYNYISSLSCYIGFTIGCLFGQEIKIARWIFAISGGTTLYIGLAVLVSFYFSNFIISFQLIFFVLASGSSRRI
jgi:zinc transporter ZupT